MGKLLPIRPVLAMYDGRVQVELSPEAVAAAEAVVSSGRCATVDEAVRLAFFALAEDEREQDGLLAAIEADPEWKAEIERKIQEGLDDVEAGRTVPADVAIARARELIRKKSLRQARAG